MSFTVTWVSTDITDKVISYTRDHSLCSSVGTLTVEVVGYDSYTTWDELIIRENGTKQATYNISTVTKNHNGTTTLTGENGAKRAGDYFIHTYYAPGWVSNAKYWIEKFLTEAGVTYSFNVAGTGATIDADTAFGRDTCYNLIIPFLQHSGWYIIYDEDNDAIIGTLDKDLSNYQATFTRDEIISVALRKNDKMSRNKAIVWGGRDFLREQMISASVYEAQDWQTSTNDIRPITLSNTAIKNYPTAYGIAWQLVNEFSTLTKIKELTVIGFHDVREGDVVFVKSDIYTGTGMITSLSSTASKEGETMTLTLDERCPRLFAYFAWDGYVYAGTWGAGVYRKPLEVNSWSSYNTGLDNLQIKDLYIQNGVFVCVANDGYAYRRYITDGSWVKINHGDLTDTDETEYEEADIKAVACSIDDDNNIIVGYSIESSNRSWVLHYKPLVGIIRTEQVIADDVTKDVLIYDLDNTGERTIIGVAGGAIDYTKGNGPSCQIMVDGDMDFTQATWGGNDIGYGRHHNKWSNFNNADYFITYSGLIDQEYAPRSRVSSPYYGPTLAYDDWNYHAFLGTFPTPYDAKISRYKAHNEAIGTSVDFPPWDGSFWYNRWTQRYAVYDADTIIAIDGTAVYKVDFTGGGSYSSIGTLSTPSTWCDGELVHGPYIEAFWTNGSSLVIFYFYSHDTYNSIPTLPTNKYYTAVYNGSFTDNGEFGAYPFVNTCIDGDICYWNAAAKWGQLTKNTATVVIYSAEYDDYIYETSPDPTLVDHKMRAYTISLSTGVAGAAGELEPKQEWNFGHDKVAEDQKIYPVSHTMYLQGGSYYYTVGAGGVSETAGSHGKTAIGVDHIKWQGGIANVNLTTGAITTIEGSFPLSSLTYTNNSNISPIASDTDGTVVYWNDTIASGIVIENGTDIVQLKPTAQSPPGNPTILDSIYLIGNRIVTGAELYTVSGYLTPDDTPTASGTVAPSGGYVLRDNYLLGDIIPSGLVGFTTVLSGINGSPHIELSKTAPTIVHTESSGIVPSNMYSSFTNTSGSFTPIAAGYRKIVNDVRVYTEFNENVPESGGFKVGIASPSGFLKTLPDLSEEFTVAFSGYVVSGEVLKLETTNYDTPPFFFIVTGSGANQKFYQRNPSSSAFFEHSTGLPTTSGMITIIRADDGM